MSKGTNGNVPDLPTPPSVPIPKPKVITEPDQMPVPGETKRSDEPESRVVVMGWMDGNTDDEGKVRLSDWTPHRHDSGSSKANGCLTALLVVALTITATVLALVQHNPHRTLRHIPDAASAAAYAPAPVHAVELTPLAAALAAHPVTVQPRPGDGWITLVTRTCGTARTWQQQRARNGGAAWLYLGRSYSIDCSLTGTPAPAAPAPSSTWVRPLGGSWCFTPNGSREFGTNRGDHRHGGIDLGAPVGADYGDPIRAIHAGVAHHGWEANGAGTYVWVDHGDGTSAWFFHMSSRAVGNGAWVSAGQTIGYVGRSGNATAVHVHLETRINGGRVDPVRFLADRGVPIRC